MGDAVQSLETALSLDPSNLKIKQKVTQLK